MRLLPTATRSATSCPTSTTAPRRRVGSMSRPRWYMDQGLEDVIGRDQADLRRGARRSGGDDGRLREVRHRLGRDRERRRRPRHGPRPVRHGCARRTRPVGLPPRNRPHRRVAARSGRSTKPSGSPWPTSARTSSAMSGTSSGCACSTSMPRYGHTPTARVTSSGDRGHRSVVLRQRRHRGASKGRARSQPTRRPDLEVNIDILSAAYPGAVRRGRLADAGQIDVHRTDAVDDADSLFVEFPAPFCGTFY